MGIRVCWCVALVLFLQCGLTRGAEGIRSVKKMACSQGEMTMAQISQDGTSFVTAPFNFRTLGKVTAFPIQLRDRETLKVLKTLQGHTLPVVCMAFSDDGSKLFSGSMDGTLRVWDARSGKQLTSIEVAGYGVRVLHPSKDGVTVAAILDGLEITNGMPRPKRGVKSTARVWDVATGKLLTSVDTPAAMGDVALSSDGKLLAAMIPGGVAVYEVPTGKIKQQLKAPEDLYYTSMTFSADGKRLFLVGIRRSFTVMDVGSGKILSRWSTPKSGQGGDLFSACVYGQSRRALLGLESTIILWDAENGKALGDLKTPSDVLGMRGISVSKDGRWGVSTHKDGTVLVLGLE